MEIADRRFFCSWSGGKDSTLSLYKAIRGGGVPVALFTMMAEGGERSRAHGLSISVLRAQSKALGIPLVSRSASWDEYEGVFREAAAEFAAKGVKGGVFGDIDLDEHRAWCVRVCREAGAEAFHPLWKMGRLDVVKEFLDSGFQAYVVAVKDGLGRNGDAKSEAEGEGDAKWEADAKREADAKCEIYTKSEVDAKREADIKGSGLIELLGKPFDDNAVKLLLSLGLDACGESGEFHTVVTGGPLFSESVSLRFGQPFRKDGHWLVDAELEADEELHGGCPGQG